MAPVQPVELGADLVFRSPPDGMAGQAFLECLLACDDVLGVRRHHAGEQKGGNDGGSPYRFGHVRIPIVSLRRLTRQPKRVQAPGFQTYSRRAMCGGSNGLLWLAATRIDAEVRTNVSADAGSGSRRARPPGTHRRDVAPN